MTRPIAALRSNRLPDILCALACVMAVVGTILIGAMANG